jgi:hypothetical protein
MASHPRVLIGTTGESWDSMARVGPFATALDCEEHPERIGNDLVRAQCSACHWVQDGRFPHSRPNPESWTEHPAMVMVVYRGPRRREDGHLTIEIFASGLSQLDFGAPSASPVQNARLSSDAQPQFLAVTDH